MSNQSIDTKTRIRILKKEIELLNLRLEFLRTSTPEAIKQAEEEGLLN